MRPTPQAVPSFLPQSDGRNNTVPGSPCRHMTPYEIDRANFHQLIEIELRECLV